MIDFDIDRKSWACGPRLLTPGRRLSRQHITRATAPHVSLDHQLAAAAEARAVDLQVLYNPLHVVARLRDRDALHPVDRIDVGVARIAIGGEPLLNPPAPGLLS